MANVICDTCLLKGSISKCITINDLRVKIVIKNNKCSYYRDAIKTYENNKAKCYVNK